MQGIVGTIYNCKDFFKGLKICMVALLNGLDEQFR